MTGDDGVRVARALFSLSDLRGAVDLAKGLAKLDVELWASSGTQAALGRDGVAARSTEELTGIGAWFGGRVKTLHPAILSGILAPRTPGGLEELARRQLLPFDLVVVNFYPFAERRRTHPDATDLEESIDVGGVTLTRAAAKNHAAVAVASDPSEYGLVLEELRAQAGRLSDATRRRLAVAAFRRCSEYDAAIAEGLQVRSPEASRFPSSLRFAREPWELRYGENPHQAAAVYRLETPLLGATSGIPIDLVKGDRLSYTNLLDLDTAVRTVAEFPTPTVAVVKHATPCGVASAATLEEAVRRAVATDPVARYGCVLAANRPFDAASCEGLRGIFVDLLAAPEFEPEARELLDRRPKVKLVRCPVPSLAEPFWEAHAGLGRLLVEEGDRRQLTPEEFRPATTARIDGTQACALDFAWRVVRHAKSNAVVLARGSATVGIGAGQTTRVKAVELACEVAGDRARGAVLASDAFFPFADGVEAAGRAGVAAILQPGGSLRDPEVLAAAEKFGIAMYLTGWRVFRH